MYQLTPPKFPDNTKLNVIRESVAGILEYVKDAPKPWYSVSAWPSSSFVASLAALCIEFHSLSEIFFRDAAILSAASLFLFVVIVGIVRLFLVIVTLFLLVV